MRTLPVLLAMLSMSLAAAGAEVSVRLVDVPAEIALPLSEGANVILTAQVGGQPRAVWLATAPDARARYLLDAVGAGAYQVNLADPVLSAMLEASGAGMVRVFAEGPDGAVSQSIPLSYTVASRSRGYSLPPRVFVQTAKKTVQVSPWSRDRLATDPFAVLAELQGQGLAGRLGSMRDYPLGRDAAELVDWFEPADVERIWVRFDSDARRTSATLKVGDHVEELGADDSRYSELRRRGLPVQDSLRERWTKAGELTLTCSQDDSSDLRVVLKAPPPVLDLPEGEAKLTIVQRRTETVPGSDGYLRLNVSDITQGQTLLTLRTADRRELLSRESLRQGDKARFRLKGAEYELELTKMVNMLFGDDYAEFVVRPVPKAE